MRSPTSQAASVRLILWGTGGTTEDTVTPVVLGSSWTLVSVTLDPSQSHSTLRAQLAIDTPNVNVDIDGAGIRG